MNAAEEHYKNGASTPFWDSIESSYQNLQKYILNINQIGQCASQYREHVTEYAKEFGVPSIPFPGFPVVMDSVESAKIADSISKQLEYLTYEAQKKATFATIWELRRQTSVLVAGFSNLSSAIGQLQVSISNSIQSLAGAIQEFSGQVRANQRETNASLSANNALLSSVGSAIDSQSRAIQQSAQELKEINWREYNRWGHGYKNL